MDRAPNEIRNSNMQQVAVTFLISAFYFLISIFQSQAFPNVLNQQGEIVARHF
jgi:hypothetical protein